MINYSIKNLAFPRIKNKKLKIDFSGGNISSDEGLIPVHLLDKKLGIISDISNAVKNFDIRSKSKIKHKVSEMLRQGIYGIISGNEDLNNQDDLRRDEVFKVLVGRGDDLAGSSTPWSFENSACREVCVKISKVFVEKFMERFKTPPKDLYQ